MAAMLSGDPRVYNLSIHGDKNYPFLKEVSYLIVLLPDRKF